MGLFKMRQNYLEQRIQMFDPEMDCGSRRRRPKLKQKFNSLITNTGGFDLGNFELEGHLLM